MYKSSYFTSKVETNFMSRSTNTWTNEFNRDVFPLVKRIAITHAKRRFHHAAHGENSLSDCGLSWGWKREWEVDVPHVGHA